MILFVVSPSCKVHILRKVSGNFSHVCPVKVPSNNEDSLRMCILQMSDVGTEDMQSHIGASIKRKIDMHECMTENVTRKVLSESGLHLLLM